MPSFGQKIDKTKSAKGKIVIPAGNYLELYHKRYSSLSETGKINESKDLFEKLISQSKSEPQPIVEISQTTGIDSIEKSRLGRLWLYNDKIYESDRNDYDQQLVKLLILDFSEKERGIRTIGTETRIWNKG